MAITLDEINQTLLEQNKSLDITARSLVKFIEGEKSRRGDELEEKLDAAREKKRVVTRPPQPQGFKAGFKQGLGDATGLGTVARWVSSALAGAFGGATLGTVAGFVGKYLARGAVWGSAALLIGKFGTQLVEKVFTSLDPSDLILDEETKKKVSPVLVESMRNGLFGMIISKRFGVASFVGTIVGNAIASIFKLDDEAKIKAFGFELPLTAKDFATFGATIGAFFAPGLILGSLRSSLSGSAPGATVGRGKDGKFTKLKPGLAKSFALSFKPRLGWGLAIAGIGNVLGAAIGGAMENPEVGQNIANAANVLGLAAMFGPKGVLIAAGVMAALAIGNQIAQWMARTSQKNAAALQAEIDRQTKTMDEKIAEGKFNEAADAGLIALSESRRLGDMQKTGAQSQSQLYLGEALAEIGRKTGNDNQVKNALRRQYKATVDLPGLSQEDRINQLGRIAGEFSRFFPGEGIEEAVLRLSTSLSENGKHGGTAGGSTLGPGGIFASMDAITAAALANPSFVQSQPIDFDFFNQYMKASGARSKRTLDVQDLMPPNIEDFSFLYPNQSPAGALAVGQVGDRNQTHHHNQQLVLAGETPTIDNLNGGSAFSDIAGYGLYR